MGHRLSLVGTALALLAAAGAAADTPPETLSCIPHCRGVDLAGAHLSNLNLNRVNLVNADHADLSDATLVGVSVVGADLTGASLFCATIEDTDLTAATVTPCRHAQGGPLW